LQKAHRGAESWAKWGAWLRVWSSSQQASGQMRRSPWTRVRALAADFHVGPWRSAHTRV